VAIIRANRLPYMRLGLSVSRRIGRAVIRNRIKRVVREGFRQAPSRGSGGLDVVIIPKNPKELQKADVIAVRLDRILKAAHFKLTAGPRS
jgi:ribonuclease P protein component